MKRILFIVFLILVAFFVWFMIFVPVNPANSNAVLFEVEKGQGNQKIAYNLEQQGLIRSAPLFRLYTLTLRISHKLQAGEYVLNSGMSAHEIAFKFIKGDVLKRYATIPEGWNLRDIGWYFERQGKFQAEELFELVGFPLIDYRKTVDLPKPKDFSSEYTFLASKPSYLGLEGYLFPDTYHIPKDAKVEDVVRKMLTNFGEKLDPGLREETAKQGKSIFEIVIMASLIEKEVRSFEDKRTVSGILWKRLSIGMPLQVDATIAYITGKKTSEISNGETKIDSPYNTYKYKGLPLGPIANPGLESIQAALYPLGTPYLYYLSTPEGKTIFSKTLEEHNIAKATYLK